MSSFTIPASAYNTYPTTPKYSNNVVLSPIWKSLEQSSASDIDSAVSLCAYPKYEVELSYASMNVSAEYPTIIGFFNQQRANVTPFNFLHPLDNTATAATFGVGTGTATQWQLMRPYGGFYEPVLAPYGTAKVFVDGVEKIATTDFSITNAGLVTFTSAPANGTVLTWTGTFWWICKFVESRADFKAFSSRLFGCDKVLLKTVKKPGLA